MSARVAMCVCLFALGTAAGQESVESKYLSGVRQITDGFVRAGEGYFSPDGRMIIYQAVPRDYPFYQIYTQSLDAGIPRRVSTGRGKTTCSYFSRDGRKILFASSHTDPELSATEEGARRQQEEDAKSGVRRRYQWDFDEHMEIYESDLEGGHLRALTDSPGYDAEGAWSPDGSKIVFCSTRDGDPDLYVMNADGSDVRQLTNAPGYDGGPFVSPDGEWVVFRSDRKEKDMLQIYVIGMDGKNEQALTDTVGVNWAPYWHPSAPYLIWTGADHSDPTARPNYDLWLLKVEVKQGRMAGGPVLRVTDHPTADVLPVFSPDGRRLMWTSNRTDDHSSQLFLGEFRLPE
jgi:Tol biopolymer transport system component